MIKKKTFLCIWLVISALGSFGQKTDKVILVNGDIITGEVKKLDLEILQFKTSTMSTAQIKWYQVSNIYSPDKHFQIDLQDKTRLYGSFDSTDAPQTLVVKGELGSFTIRSSDVVGIVQVKQRTWNRFSGSLSAGASYTKASDVAQSNLSADVSYTEDQYFGAIEYSSIQTTQFDSIYNVKQDLMANVNVMVATTQFVTAFGTGQRNTELGIDLRSSGGLGYGVDLLHNSIARIRTVLAMTGNREESLGENPVTYNAEGLLKFDARIFKYTYPEIYVNAFFNWYPSFTVTGRHRIEAELKIKLEVFNNFFLEVKGYNNYDSKPVSSSISNNDYGLITGVSYTFGL